MGEQFSKLFVRDKKSPEYTACVAVVLYNELKRVHIIENEDVVTKNCSLNDDFKIPKNDNTDKHPIDDTDHCFSPIYRYTGYLPRKKRKDIEVLDREWINLICNEAKFTGRFILNDIERKVARKTTEYFFKRYLSGKFPDSITA